MFRDNCFTLVVSSLEIKELRAVEDSNELDSLIRVQISWKNIIFSPCSSKTLLSNKWFREELRVSHKIAIRRLHYKHVVARTTGHRSHQHAYENYDTLLLIPPPSYCRIISLVMFSKLWNMGQVKVRDCLPAVYLLPLKPNELPIQSPLQVFILRRPRRTEMLIWINVLLDSVCFSVFMVAYDPSWIFMGQLDTFCFRLRITFRYVCRSGSIIWFIFVLIKCIQCDTVQDGFLTVMTWLILNWHTF